MTCRPKPASSRGQTCTCLQRASSLCLFLFLTSILVREELKSKSAKSAQSSEPLVDLEIRPHLLLLFGFMSPLFCSRPARIFCVCKQRRGKRKATSVGFNLSVICVCVCARARECVCWGVGVLACMSTCVCGHPRSASDVISQDAVHSVLGFENLGVVA